MSALPDLRGKDLSALTPKERYRIPLTFPRCG